jgi:hypothetical protein
MRVLLAFQVFFLLLFGKKLPPTVAPYLPEGLVREPEALPAPAAAAEPRPAEPRPAEPRPAEPRPDKKRGADVAQHHRDGALALLALLQREGRLVDFLREGLEGHDDATIGAAARDVHRGCKKVLDQHFAFEPMLPGTEEDAITVPRGFDPAEIRLVGDIAGEPPFRGTLRHHGWRATSITLPGLSDGVDRTVVAPAEVEVGPRT